MNEKRKDTQVQMIRCFYVHNFIQYLIYINYIHRENCLTTHDYYIIII